MLQLQLEPHPTRWDLKWRMFGIPVRVHPLFWLMALIFSYQDRMPGDLLAITVVCIFISILVHEFGHAFCQRHYGDRANHVVLYQMGGLAVGSREPSRVWPRVAISLAGPGAGFVLGGLALLAEWGFETGRLPVPGLHLLWAIGALIWINFVWGVFNLLPIFPLDGGNIARAIIKHRARRNADLKFFTLSFWAGVIAALLCLAWGIKSGESLMGFYPALLFGLLAFQSFTIRKQLARYGGELDEPEEVREAWQQDPDWWKRGGR